MVGIEHTSATAMRISSQPGDLSENKRAHNRASTKLAPKIVRNSVTPRTSTLLLGLFTLPATSAMLNMLRSVGTTLTTYGTRFNMHSRRHVRGGRHPGLDLVKSSMRLATQNTGRIGRVSPYTHPAVLEVSLANHAVRSALRCQSLAGDVSKKMSAPASAVAPVCWLGTRAIIFGDRATASWVRACFPG